MIGGVVRRPASRELPPSAYASSTEAQDLPSSPSDLSWRLERPALTAREREGLIAANVLAASSMMTASPPPGSVRPSARPPGAAQPPQPRTGTEYVSLATRVGGSSLERPSARGGGGGLSASISQPGLNKPSHPSTSRGGGGSGGGGGGGVVGSPNPYFGERPPLVGIRYADGYEPQGGQPPVGTVERRAGSPPQQHPAMRHTVSAGSLRYGMPTEDARAAAAAKDVRLPHDYLQKLPPVVRRSVTGTGPRQHTARNLFSPHQPEANPRAAREKYGYSPQGDGLGPW